METGESGSRSAPWRWIEGEDEAECWLCLGDTLFAGAKRLDLPELAA